LEKNLLKCHNNQESRFDTYLYFYGGGIVGNDPMTDDLVADSGSRLFDPLAAGIFLDGAGCR
jgi:hypothetical protein